MPGGIWSQRFSGYSPAYPADTAWLFAPKDWQPGKGNRRIVLANHGHGGSDAWGSDVTNFDPNYHVWRLVRAGYVVVALNNLGQTTFGSPAVCRALDDAYAWAMGTARSPSTRVGVLGWSMGGLASLNWIRRNKAKVAAAWLWTPACDADWLNDTAGYVAPYSVGTVGYPTVYAAELAAAYASSTTAVSAVTIPASGSAGVALAVADAKGFADGAGPTLPKGSAGGGTFTWTGKDDGHLYGCVSTGAALSVAAGGAVATTFAQQKHGYSPTLQPSAFADPGFPLKVATAGDDATIPVGQSQWLVQQVADPLVTFRQVSSGGHTALFGNVPPDEHQALFESGRW